MVLASSEEIQGVVFVNGSHLQVGGSIALEHLVESWAVKTGRELLLNGHRLDLHPGEEPEHCRHEKADHYEDKHLAEPLSFRAPTSRVPADLIRLKVLPNDIAGLSRFFKLEVAIE